MLQRAVVEAATLRAVMVSTDCECLETWLKTSVHDADRKARLYALLRHAAFESWLAALSCVCNHCAIESFSPRGPELCRLAVRPTPSRARPLAPITSPIRHTPALQRLGQDASY